MQELLVNPSTSTVRNTKPEERAPIYEALLAYQQRKVAPLHTPGHKGTFAADGILDFMTPLGLACDLPSMDATDFLFHPSGCIAEAQRLAAELWGAADTFFLVHGSTIGVQAMVLAAVRPGEKIILSRHVHLSVFSALVLSGATPVFLPSMWFEFGGPVPVLASDLENALALHNDARAVLLTHPSYYGLGGDLRPISSICAQRKIPLLVDEAHGAHLRFVPQQYLRSALEQGADLVVQSVHKTVGSLIGTAQLHRGHQSLISHEQVQRALNLLESTSSSYLLLASLDLTRRHMSQNGSALFREACARFDLLRRNLASIPGIATLLPGSNPTLKDCAIDPLRLVIDVSGLGLTGYEMERRLQQDFGILDEFCDSCNVVFVLGPADPPEVYVRLEDAFREVACTSVRRAPPPSAQPRTTPAPHMALTPREAAFQKSRRISLRDAAGSICAEVISVYPPGIPLLFPGEVFTRQVLSYLEYLSERNICIYARDPSLSTVSIIDL